MILETSRLEEILRCPFRVVGTPKPVKKPWQDVVINFMRLTLTRSYVNGVVPSLNTLKRNYTLLLEEEKQGTEDAGVWKWWERTIEFQGWLRKELPAMSAVKAKYCLLTTPKGFDPVKLEGILDAAGWATSQTSGILGLYTTSQFPSLREMIEIEAAEEMLGNTVSRMWVLRPTGMGSSSATRMTRQSRRDCINAAVGAVLQGGLYPIPGPYCKNCPTEGCRTIFESKIKLMNPNKEASTGSRL